jgi:hypothetical protein
MVCLPGLRTQAVLEHSFIKDNAAIAFAKPKDARPELAQ